MLESVKAAVKTGLGRISAAIKPGDYGYKEDLVNYINTEYERRQAERRPHELQWRLILNFLDGNQYLDINSAALDLTEIPKLYWFESREVFNHLAPILETRVARFSRMQPRLKIRPATSENSDISGAKIGLRLLDYVQNERLTGDPRQALYQWMDSLGTVFLKNVWNPRLGRRVGAIALKAQSQDQPQKVKQFQDTAPDSLDNAGKRISENLDQQQPQQDNNTVQIQESDNGVLAGTIQALYEGDVDPVIVPPYEIYPDSTFNPTVGDCRSILHCRAYHVDQVYEMYGVKVDPEPVESFRLAGGVRGSFGLGYGGNGFTTTVSKLEGYAIVKEMWERPSMAYPQGRLIVVCNDKVLYVGPLPYKVGTDDAPDLPFVKIEAIKRPGCFWGRSVMERLIPIQRRYNTLRNRKAEFLNRVAIGQLAVEEGSIDLDDTEENGGGPGYIHVYRKGFTPPHYLQFPPLPAAFETEETSLLNEFTVISGVSELARNSTPAPGTRSGIAMSLAIEQDDTRLSHTVGNYENAVVLAGKQWLRLYKQFATQKRLLKMVGTDLEVELMEWDRSDIRSDDVVVETSALLAETPAQRRQTIYELFQIGLFNDPETGRLTKQGQKRLIDMLQLGHWEFISADDIDNLQAVRAEKENRAMSKGAMPQPQDIDNDQIHLEHHTRYRLTGEYEEIMAATGGQVDMIFQQHSMMHFQRIQQAMQAQMQQQAQMVAAQNQHPPGETMSFKDLPLEGQVQMAKQAGIELTPQGLMQAKIQDQALAMAQAQAKAKAQPNTQSQNNKTK